MPLYRVKISLKIGPVVSVENKITDGNCVACSRWVRRILSNISRCTGSIFTSFSLNDSVLGADDRSRPLLSISQGTLPWQPILWKNGKLCTFIALAFRNGMGLCHIYAWLSRGTYVTISCKILVKIGRVVSTENSRMETAWCIHIVIWYI